MLSHFALSSAVAVFLVLFGMNSLATDESEEEAAQPDLVVIAHASAGIEYITSEELRRIYFGKKHYWQNGVRILPVDLKTHTPAREIWLDEALGISNKQYKRIWLRNTFSGMAVPPVSFSSTKTLIEYVSEHEGSLGYVPFPSDSLPGTIKVMKVDSLAGIFTHR